MIENVCRCDRCKRRSTRLYKIYSIGQIEEEPSGKNVALIDQMKGKEWCDSCMLEISEFAKEYKPEDEAQRWLMKILAQVENLICQYKSIDSVDANDIPEMLADILEEKLNK